jgi:hypothetical protein
MIHVLIIKIPIQVINLSNVLIFVQITHKVQFNNDFINLNIMCISSYSLKTLSASTSIYKKHTTRNEHITWRENPSL